MSGGELLQRRCIPEPLHRSVSSSARLVEILGAIVAPPTPRLIASFADDLDREPIRPKPVGYDQSRSAVTQHGALQEFQRGSAIPAILPIAMPDNAFLSDTLMLPAFLHHHW